MTEPFIPNNVHKLNQLFGIETYPHKPLAIPSLEGSFCPTSYL